MNETHDPQPNEPSKYVRPVIDIPDSAYVVKARFWERPPQRLVLAIIKHIQANGRAHDHPDLTHTKAPMGAHVVYLETFDLPDKFARYVDQWLPCPICTPFLPHFKEDGIVAWFPDEGVIRVIGGDCFKKLNPEGHEEALRELERDKRQRRDEAYLVRYLWAVPAIRADVLEDKAIAHVVDTVRAELVDVLKEYGIPLWSNIRFGMLENEVRCVEYPRGRRKETVRREVHAFIRGEELISPFTDGFEIRADQMVQALSKIDLGENWDEVLTSMSEEHKRELAHLYRDSMKQILASREAIDEARRLLRAETLATLRTWSKLPGTTCPFFLDFDETHLRHGLSPTRSRHIEIPSKFFEELTALPSVPFREPH